MVEVVAPESAARDRADKFYEYEAAGIPEYWLFDPRQGKERVDGYRLTPHGTSLAILPAAEGRYHSTIPPGFWFRPEWLWQEAAPNPLLPLTEIAPAAFEPVLAALAARRES